MHESNQQTETGGMKEELTGAGRQLVDKVRELIAAGNMREIVIKHDGRTVAEFPLTVGVIGTVLAPQLAALGAIATLLTESTIQVVHTNTATPPSNEANRT